MTNPFDGEVITYLKDGTKYTLSNPRPTTGADWDVRLTQDGATKPFNGQVLVATNTTGTTKYTLSKVQPDKGDFVANLNVSGSSSGADVDPSPG